MWFDAAAMVNMENMVSEIEAMRKKLEVAREALQTAERLADDKGSDLQYEIIAKALAAIDNPASNDKEG